MPRIRSLKPEFCTSEAIVVLTIPCRLHFAMLWTYADDEGRGVDNPRLIKAALWPLDDDVTADDVEGWQKELESHGRLVRYEADGKGYFEIVNFLEHQRPSKPQTSKYPPVPGAPSWDDGAVPGPFPEQSGNGCESVPDRSCPVDVDVDGVVDVDGEGEGNGQPITLPLTGRALAVVGNVSPTPHEDGFDTFWARCPRKVGKPHARKAWLAARHKATEQAILDGMGRWAAHWRDARTDLNYIPHPSTWLNREGWNDEPPPARSAGGRRSSTDDRLDATRRVAERIAAQEAAR